MPRHLDAYWPSSAPVSVVTVIDASDFTPPASSIVATTAVVSSAVDLSCGPISILECTPTPDADATTVGAPVTMSATRHSTAREVAPGCAATGDTTDGIASAGCVTAGGAVSATAGGVGSDSAPSSPCS